MRIWFPVIQFEHKLVAVRLSAQNLLKKKYMNTLHQLERITIYRDLGSNCQQKIHNFFACIIGRITKIVLFGHKFDTVLYDIEVGSVFC